MCSNARETFLAQPTLTLNRAARLGRLPSPRWCASNSLRRKSSEYTFAIAVLRQKRVAEQIILLQKMA